MNLLTKDAKRLMIIHNFSGILRILISTFLSIFILKQCGMSSILLFYIIVRVILAFLFFILSHKVSQKKYLGLYRIGILIQFLFLILLICNQNHLKEWLVPIAIIQGVGDGFYWFAYNNLAHDACKLDARIRYFGYSNVFSRILHIIIPITLGALITLESYHYTFIIISVLMAFLFLYSFKLNTTMEEHKVSLRTYFKRVRKEKTLQSLYYEAFLEGITTDTFTNIVLPLLIYMAFQSEFSLGAFQSVFALLAALISYIGGKKILGQHMMKCTSIAIIGLVFSSLLYFIDVNVTTVILYNICYYFLTPIRDIGYSHYASNIIDIEKVEEERVEHFVIREIVLNAGRLVSYLIVFVIITMFGEELATFKILTLVLTLPALFIIFHINRIEKHVQKLLGQS